MRTPLPRTTPTWLTMLLILVALVALAAALVTAPAPARADAPQDTSGYIVMLHDGESQRAVALDEATGEVTEQDVDRAREETTSTTVTLSEEVRARGVTVTHVYEGLGGFAADLSPDDLAWLRSHPAVAWVEPDAPAVSAARQPDAPWNLDRIDMAAPALDSFYTYPATGAGVTAYVIDTGIRSDHTEFAGRILPGYSSIADDRGTVDCHGHGTGVASVLAGETYGVAKQAAVVPVRVLDCDSIGSISSLIDGIDWVTRQARTVATPSVANLSVQTEPSASFDAAVRELIASGVSTTVAAGNGGADACTVSPARLDQAITVANSTRSENREGTSNYGPCVDLFAPGTAVAMAGIAAPDAQVLNTGSSFAAPHVAGAAALILEDAPAAPPARVKELILAAATPGALGNLPAGTPNRLLFIPEVWEAPARPIDPVTPVPASALPSSVGSSA